jgi:hypothetical protein
MNKKPNKGVMLRMAKDPTEMQRQKLEIIEFEIK